MCNNNRCNGSCNRCESTCDPCRKQPKIYYCGADISCAGVIRGEEISRAIKKLGDKLCQTVNQQNPLTYVNITDATEEQCETGGFVLQILQVGSDNLVSEHILCSDGNEFEFSEDIVCGEDTIIAQGSDIEEGFNRVVDYFCERVNNINLNLIIDTTYSELQTLIAESNLEKGKFYHNTENGVILQALETNVISTTGTRVMRIVKNLYYTPDTGILGVWNASLTPTIGDVAIWGGKVWENTTGSVGTFTDDTALDPTDWVLIPTTNDTYYFTKSFGCNYDIVNDWVASQWDDRGNVFTLSWGLGQHFGLTFSTNDFSDWGNELILNNTCYGIYNNSNAGFIALNSNAGSIFSNSNEGSIYNNSNSGYITSNSNTGGISSNSNTGEIYNNSNTGSIFNNSNTGEIFDNTNTKDISGNSNLGGIYNNSNSGYITSNSNTGEIYSNSNEGSIYNNSNSGYITFNSNTGEIYSNSNVGSINSITSDTTDIYYNTNNGEIITTVVGVITDPIVNK